MAHDFGLKLKFKLDENEPGFMRPLKLNRYRGGWWVFFACFKANLRLRGLFPSVWRPPIAENACSPVFGGLQSLKTFVP